ncbi:MAG: type II toxin-antitoxin system VapB family antitoxin [Propionibacteriaceae bacterium]|nr:type II toxin-antitoxin system VapB family antitoxin [Propionibacteriaceae bacterium]
MSLNVKNPETVRLVATLAKRLHVTQVQAINEAVSAKLEALDKTASPDVDSVLADIWNALTPDEIQAVQDRQAALYNEAGLPV